MGSSYTVVDQEVWVVTRQMYGTMTAPAICRVLPVKTSALYRRARVEGWRKLDLVAQRAEETAAVLERARAMLPTEAAEPPAATPEPLSDDPLAIVQAALRQAKAALAQGKSAEAQAHIKAGLAVAELAEVARGLKAARGG